VLAVVALLVVVLVLDGVWVQSFPDVGLTAPVLRLGATDVRRPVTVWASVATLVLPALAQVCTGTWLLLRFSTLSLLKPFGPAKLAALAMGADRAMSAPVPMASAKARFFTDMLVFPQVMC
jgi:hypothetical protein